MDGLFKELEDAMIMCGINYLKENFEKAMSEGLELPQYEMEYAYGRYLETRGQGSFDKRRTVWR